MIKKAIKEKVGNGGPLDMGGERLAKWVVDKCLGEEDPEDDD